LIYRERPRLRSGNGAFRTYRARYSRTNSRQRGEFAHFIGER
jgi:hypothetical protein